MARGAPVLVDVIRLIGDQAAGGDEDTIEVNSGQLVPRRQRDDQIAMITLLLNDNVSYCFS